jgi:hypothetical protein
LKGTDSMSKRTTTMLGTTLAAIALTAFAGPAYGGGNGKGADPQATSSAPGNSENAPGQVKKAEQAPQALPSASGDAAGNPGAAPVAVPPSTQPEAGTGASEPAAPQVNKEGHGESKASPSASTSASSAARKDGHARPKTGGHGNSTHAAASPAQGDPTATAASVGVKPSNSTSHNVAAPAGSNSTKLYGNGQTAGQIAIRHGASPSTMLYGPGNSQSHKVAPCGQKAHGNGGGVDVHALKSHGGKGGCVGADSPATGAASAPHPSPRTPQTATSSAPARSVAAVSTAAAPPAIARDEHRPAVDKPKAAGSSTSKIVRKDTVHATAPFMPPRVPFATPKDHGDTSTHFALTGAPRGTLPFTGIQLWALATVGLGLVGAGWMLRRHAHAAA